MTIVRLVTASRSKCAVKDLLIERHRSRARIERMSSFLRFWGLRSSPAPRMLDRFVCLASCLRWRSRAITNSVDGAIVVEFEIPIDEALTLEVGQVATNDDDLIAVCVGRRVAGAAAINDEKYLVAFSTICTHMGCHLAQVRHEPEDGASTDSLTLGPCACHGTLFDLLKSGLVVLGPATQNLPQLRLMRDEKRIYAEGWVFRGGHEQTPPTERSWPCSDEQAETTDGGQ